jgi:uncharacterized protein (TIGR03437 family)
MNRNALIFLVLCFSATVSAQNAPVTSIRIGSDTIPWALFAVDGQKFTGLATFTWPQGSTHTVQVLSNIGAFPQNCPANLYSAVQQSQDATTAILFTAWTDNTGDLQPTGATELTITANPSVTSLIANFTVAYRVILNLFSGDNPGNPQFCQPTTTSAIPPPPPDQVRPGVVIIDENAYWNSAILYLPSGSHTLNAFPYPGFAFTGWGYNAGAATPFLTSIDLEGPSQLIPYFVPAKRVRFLTNPMGLQVLVDHSPVLTVPSLNLTTGTVDTCPPTYERQPLPPVGILPLCYGDFDFAPGSTHIISGPTPQSDVAGKVWAFDSWNTGGGQNTVYTTDSNVASMGVMTANFLPGAAISLYTNPPGLPLNVDGRSNWPSPTFIWALGSMHTVIANPTATDSKGRKYNFQAWTNGGAEKQQISVDQAAVDNGFRMTANYNILSRLIIQTSPPGITVQVNGVPCVSPCTIDKPGGSQVKVTAPTSVSINSASRFDFMSWSDGGASNHIYTLAADTQTLAASYQAMYHLAASSTPAGGATLEFFPSTPDMFFPNGQPVTVIAQMNPGYKFLRWTGDLNGTYPTSQVTMSQPVSIMAQLGTVPYIPPAGIQNAAGVTPSTAVAPGSLISIAGASLTANAVIGPANPLTQTLDGIVVTLGDSFFPLVSVSPSQIVAQLPGSLTDGNYTLTVSATGQPDVTGAFTVARNAPGLFTWSTDSRPIALAYHQNGSAITPDSPAIQGETVTIYGTGFGPCQQAQVAGFLLQGGPPNPLSDTLSISLGSFQPTPTFSGAAPDKIGMEVTKFQITPDLPSATTLSLTVTINGQTSNAVLLPLQ